MPDRQELKARLQTIPETDQDFGLVNAIIAAIDANATDEALNKLLEIFTDKPNCPAYIIIVEAFNQQRIESLWAAIKQHAAELPEIKSLKLHGGIGAQGDKLDNYEQLLQTLESISQQSDKLRQLITPMISHLNVKQLYLPLVKKLLAYFQNGEIQQAYKSPSKGGYKVWQHISHRLTKYFNDLGYFAPTTLSEIALLVPATKLSISDIFMLILAEGAEYNTSSLWPTEITEIAKLPVAPDTPLTPEQIAFIESYLERIKHIQPEHRTAALSTWIDLFDKKIPQEMIKRKKEIDALKTFSAGLTNHHVYQNTDVNIYSRKFIEEIDDKLKQGNPYMATFQLVRIMQVLTRVNSPKYKDLLEDITHFINTLSVHFFLTVISRYFKSTNVIIPESEWLEDISLDETQLRERFNLLKEESKIKNERSTTLKYILNLIDSKLALAHELTEPSPREQEIAALKAFIEALPNHPQHPYARVYATDLMEGIVGELKNNNPFIATFCLARKMKRLETYGYMSDYVEHIKQFFNTLSVHFLLSVISRYFKSTNVIIPESEWLEDVSLDETQLREKFKLLKEKNEIKRDGSTTLKYILDLIDSKLALTHELTTEPAVTSSSSTATTSTTAETTRPTATSTTTAAAAKTTTPAATTTSTTTAAAAKTKTPAATTSTTTAAAAKTKTPAAATSTTTATAAKTKTPTATTTSTTTATAAKTTTPAATTTSTTTATAAKTKTPTATTTSTTTAAAAKTKTPAATTTSTTTATAAKTKTPAATTTSTTTAAAAKLFAMPSSITPTTTQTTTLMAKDVGGSQLSSTQIQESIKAQMKTKFEPLTGFTCQASISEGQMVLELSNQDDMLYPIYASSNAEAERIIHHRLQHGIAIEGMSCVIKTLSADPENPQEYMFTAAVTFPTLNYYTKVSDTSNGLLEKLKMAAIASLYQYYKPSEFSTASTTNGSGQSSGGICSVEAPRFSLFDVLLNIKRSSSNTGKINAQAFIAHLLEAKTQDEAFLVIKTHLQSSPGRWDERSFKPVLMRNLSETFGLVARESWDCTSALAMIDHIAAAPTVKRKPI